MVPVSNNAKNDALLHRLVHTKLLSGSLNPELNLTPAERRKALAGRVLELAGESKLGKGETSVRVAERNKAAKHVREGLVRKQHERETAQLEEVNINCFGAVQLLKCIINRRNSWGITILPLRSYTKAPRRLLNTRGSEIEALQWGLASSVVECSN